MGNPTILIDTSILIEYFRKKKKEKTILYNLSSKYNFAISTITEFEFLVGFGDKDLDFAGKLLAKFSILPFNSECVKVAREIYKDLRSKNKLILPPDIFIAATAIHHDLQLITLNVKHFRRISTLKLFSIKNIIS